MRPRPRRPPLFPYTTLFRSLRPAPDGVGVVALVFQQKDLLPPGVDAPLAPLRSKNRFERFPGDRKSTRLNSSHRCISYAVFCLKKKREVKAPSRQGTDGEGG